MSKPEKIMMRVEKGFLSPADRYAQAKLKERAYSVGDIVAAVITKPRNPGFHRLAHQIGSLCAENIEDFTGMQSHAILKRLQLEGRICCTEIMYKLSGITITQFIPDSLSFESMDESQFHDVVRGICRTIATNYWPGIEPDVIEKMAEAMITE